MNQVLGSPLVLLVEDNLQLREKLALTFRLAGWTVLETSSGEGALTYLGLGDTIRAVVTDIQLSGALSGWDVADTFRAADPHLPVVYVSGSDADPRRMVADSLFFAKPYRTADISDACASLGQLEVPNAWPEAAAKEGPSLH